MKIKKILAVSLAVASVMVMSQSALATKSEVDAVATIDCKDIVIDKGDGVTVIDKDGKVTITDKDGKVTTIDKASKSTETDKPNCTPRKIIVNFKKLIIY
ncbi:hypothetical protein [Paenibacillus popilliae]|uniref:hypothetical protein n=1 Tax=Paenibacillus popilliae TaxID=78057 RepID=UPI0005A8BB2D|nr:hypothetical protein [Paenibacillus popilliae]